MPYRRLISGPLVRVVAPPAGGGVEPTGVEQYAAAFAYSAGTGAQNLLVNEYADAGTHAQQKSTYTGASQSVDYMARVQCVRTSSLGVGAFVFTSKETYKVYVFAPASGALYSKDLSADAKPVRSALAAGGYVWVHRYWLSGIERWHSITRFAMDLSDAGTVVASWQEYDSGGFTFLGASSGGLFVETDYSGVHTRYRVAFADFAVTSQEVTGQAFMRGHGYPRADGLMVFLGASSRSATSGTVYVLDADAANGDAVPLWTGFSIEDVLGSPALERLALSINGAGTLAQVSRAKVGANYYHAIRHGIAAASAASSPSETFTFDTAPDSSFPSQISYRSSAFQLG